MAHRIPGSLLVLLAILTIPTIIFCVRSVVPKSAIADTDRQIVYLPKTDLTRVALALLSLFFAASAISKDEQLGPTHPIFEPNLLEEIYSNLRKKEASGELARIQNAAIERAKRSAVEPSPVTSLTRTHRARRFYWDPTFIADRDVHDHQGNTIVAKGTRLNPLEYVSWPQNFLFFDGRDPEQVIFAKKLLGIYKGKLKPILIGGNVLETSKALDARMYFDQGGYLVGRFGIRQVPAMVSQEQGEKRLRIDEMLVPSKGEAQSIGP